MQRSSSEDMYLKVRHGYGLVACRDLDWQFNRRIHQLTDRLLDIRLSIDESENETLR